MHLRREVQGEVSKDLGGMGGAREYVDTPGQFGDRPTPIYYSFCVCLIALGYFGVTIAGLLQYDIADQMVDWWFMNSLEPLTRVLLLPLSLSVLTWIVTGMMDVSRKSLGKQRAVLAVGVLVQALLAFVLVALVWKLGGVEMICWAWLMTVGSLGMYLLAGGQSIESELDTDGHAHFARTVFLGGIAVFFSICVAFVYGLSWAAGEQVGPQFPSDNFAWCVLICFSAGPVLLLVARAAEFPRRANLARQFAIGTRFFMITSLLFSAFSYGAILISGDVSSLKASFSEYHLRRQAE